MAAPKSLAQSGHPQQRDLVAAAPKTAAPPPRRCRARVCIPMATAVEERSCNGAVAAADSFVRPHLRQLAAYTPIEPFEVLSARLGRAPDDIVKLDANENPYGPPDSVLRALGSMAFPHIYPDPETRRLRAALQKIHNVPAENLLVCRQSAKFLSRTRPLALLAYKRLPCRWAVAQMSS